MVNDIEMIKKLDFFGLSLNRIGFTKKEIKEYCISQGINFFERESNRPNDANYIIKFRNNVIFGSKLYAEDMILAYGGFAL